MAGAAFLPCSRWPAAPTAPRRSCAATPRLRIFRHFEIAADDGEIGLALTERGGACCRAVGLYRAQPDQAALLVAEGLRQVLDDLEVVAVGGPHGDPQRHRRIAK